MFPALWAGLVRVEAKPVSSHPHPARRRSVVDYLYLLPSLGIGYATTPSHVRELLRPAARPILDLPHDYLLVRPDSSPAEEVAVFRARGQADLIAVSMPDSECDYNAFWLYRLKNGKFHDVTHRMLPVPVRDDRFLYELPRIGTTIRVFRFDLETGARHHAFDLQWRGSHFVKVR